MEESTSTAIYTGAFVMVFVASLTVSLFLFNSISDFSERAYEYNVSVADNQTIVNVPVGAERLISPEQVASYYYNYVSYDLYEGGNTNDKYNVQIYTSTTASSQYLLKVKNNYATTKVDWTYAELMNKIGNKTYILSYESETNGKVSIVIKQATTEQINSML